MRVCLNIQQYYQRSKSCWRCQKDFEGQEELKRVFKPIQKLLLLEATGFMNDVNIFDADLMDAEKDEEVLDSFHGIFLYIDGGIRFSSST